MLPLSHWVQQFFEVWLQGIVDVLRKQRFIQLDVVSKLCRAFLRCFAKWRIGYNHIIFLFVYFLLDFYRLNDVAQ